MNILYKHPKKLVIASIFLIVCILGVLLYQYIQREQIVYKPLENLQEVDRIQYIYTDASIEPAYHRSYQIILSKNGEGAMYVSNYSMMLNRVSFTISPEQFEVIKKSIQTSIQQKEIINQDKRKYTCVGGSTSRLILLQGQTQRYSLVFSTPCHSDKSIDKSTAVGDIKRISREMQDMVPNFSENLQKISR